ncbi:hypothetical protein F5884DRAFT_766082 [Xylogone sp. PMI_703]|nr:hypothetical protein F5884DRAFT_766082 [Xylogone sp. PMI_703]
MDIQLSYNDNEYVKSCFPKSQCLEVAYQESLRKTDMIVQDEAARRLRLQILLLENQNDELHEQLAVGEERIDGLEEEGERLQLELQAAQDYSSHYANELRLKERELNNLKVELDSMNGANMDSTKILTEKLSLARELATLKPEVEHLRSQVAFQQTVLAEKLALQRQVFTLEVELENEKRASKRAAEKDSNDNEIAAELKQQIEDLQKEHAREKREMERKLKESEKESQESEARISLLESKLEQMRTKLRASKEQLKECQTELAQARAAASKTSETSKQSNPTSKTSRKRTALEISSDAAIGTPDGVAGRGKRGVLKRGKVEQTILGEKSTFSITPYLNRTATAIPGSSDQKKDEEEAEGKLESGPEQVKATPQELSEQDTTIISDTPITPASHVPKSRKRAIAKPVKTDEDRLQAAKTGEVSNSQLPPKKPQAKSKLGKAVEEGDDENSQPETGEEPPNKEAKSQDSKPPKLQLKSTEDTEPKKKKRKLLNGGKTLFDEDDAEASKRPAKPLGVQRLLGKRGVKGANATAFSPLKRERKGGNAP